MKKKNTNSCPSHLQFRKFEFYQIWGVFYIDFLEIAECLKKLILGGIYDGTLTTAIQKEFRFRIWLVEIWPFQLKTYLAKFPLSLKAIFHNVPPRFWLRTSGDGLVGWRANNVFKEQ